MGIPTAAYTMGTFQYFLLYIWPRPGKTAEYIAALRGSKVRFPAESLHRPFLTFLLGTTLPVVSLTMSVSFCCDTASMGIERIIAITKKTCFMQANLSRDTDLI